MQWHIRAELDSSVKTKYPVSKLVNCAIFKLDQVESNAPIINRNGRDESAGNEFNIGKFIVQADHLN